MKTWLQIGNLYDNTVSWRLDCCQYGKKYEARLDTFDQKFFVKYKTMQVQHESFSLGLALWDFVFPKLKIHLKVRYGNFANVKRNLTTQARTTWKGSFRSGSANGKLWNKYIEYQGELFWRHPFIHFSFLSLSYFLNSHRLYTWNTKYLYGLISFQFRGKISFTNVYVISILDFFLNVYL